MDGVAGGVTCSGGRDRGEALLDGSWARALRFASPSPRFFLAWNQPLGVLGADSARQARGGSVGQVWGAEGDTVG